MTRVLLTGADGMLGTALCRAFTAAFGAGAVTALTRADFDIQSRDWRRIPVSGHDWVVNAAGLINRRSADDEAFWTVNAVFPQALAALSLEAGARMIHVSTDCVFDGRQGPYGEDAPPGAADLYGRSKALGEPPTAMTLRTSIIGPEGKNFYNLLCWTLRQTQVNGFVNHRWNGLTTCELARVVTGLIERGVHVPGVRHVHSDDVTKCDLVRMICDAFRHPAAIRPTDAPEPRDMRLRTRDRAFLAALGIRPLARQVADLAAVSTPEGHWRPPS